jgi:hypothetical protein
MFFLHERFIRQKYFILFKKPKLLGKQTKNPAQGGKEQEISNLIA